MKKICITFCVLLILIAAALTAGTQSACGGQTEYLRIHVRANSNSERDQAIKYAVRDEAVAFLTPYVAQCDSLPAAMDKISGITGRIEDVCDRALAGEGAAYSSHAEVRREYFPTRVYDGLTLGAGYYDALIIELGEGEGDNWWCVIYPPLCFTSGTADIRYRSIIHDIIDKFFKQT